MTTKTKIKLALANLGHEAKKLITQPYKFATELLDTIIDPLAQDELQRQKAISLPSELRFAYQREWSYTTLSDKRAEAGRKGGKANSNK